MVNYTMPIPPALRFATGLGSVDANAFVKAWPGLPARVSAVVPSIDLALIVGTPYQGFATSIQIADSAPGIFAANGATVPFPTVKRGDTSVLFITGEGKVSPPIARLPAPSAQPQNLTIGGKSANIAFIGIPSGLVGVTQINFVVLPDVPLGIQPVVVTIGGTSSLPVNITVTN
jgi:uncharacterized protein (TIGR03437 family)